MNFEEIIDHIREEVPQYRKRGECFEKICKAFLKNDPRYKDMFSNVWLWHEFPDRKEADTGVDIVAKEHNGERWAIQCKFYDETHSLQKSDIDSFFTTSGRYGFTQRVIVSTTDKWSKNAEQALEGQAIPVKRWGIGQLNESPLEWANIYNPHQFTIREKKKLRPHQQEALNDVVNGFKEADRGRLIMACGTGKTFTSLKIMEELVPQNGTVLFLVPSISLLSQALNEWASEAEIGQRNFAVCSDSKVGKNRNSEDIRAHELAFPTTTDPQKLATKLKEASHDRINIVFSTYHSIDVTAKAQKLGAPAFDLVICDEAHRTTGVEKSNEEASYFTKIHNADLIKAKKRLYMTATPRIYSDSAKQKADEHQIDYFSMDEEATYGKEFHRLNFSEAIQKDLLSDYKVFVLAVNENHVSNTMQNQLAERGELNLEDTAKIIGCYKGLKKEFINREEAKEIDKEPMKRAVTFCTTIKNSKQITDMFAEVVNAYAAGENDKEPLHCEFAHVDGTQNSLIRDQKLHWLKEDPPQENGTVCRILSNARCLSEGVDVPALDAVMFLNPRRSVVDVVQSVGRVMRKTAGKQYGYVILPVAVPANIPADEALRDNKRYQVVWEVLQALRSHDDRFNATLNKLELNKKLPDQIQIIGVGFGAEEETDVIAEETSRQLNLDFAEMREAIFARIVEKCGDRRYWETWAKDIAQIAETNTTRLQGLLAADEKKYRALFDDFLQGLRENINPSVSEAEAVEMLSQHRITQPVFNALFEQYAFTEQNPVSKTMQTMLDLMEDQNFDNETKTLEKFYASVRQRAEGIDNAEGKQKIIIELYDKFFKTAFPKMVERLGIVYTPLEIVDFILQSAEDILQKEFGKSLSDEGVDILDPFTGTGSFIVRLIQGNIIKDHDLKRKYQQELHANEIILLAYYIAAINIEEAYHFRIQNVIPVKTGTQSSQGQTAPPNVIDVKTGTQSSQGQTTTPNVIPMKTGNQSPQGQTAPPNVIPVKTGTQSSQGQTSNKYEPFEGILLTDTFQLEERKGFQKTFFPENDARAKKQQERNIRVIVGNPPYSAKQKSENDANKNLEYTELDKNIRNTYAKYSSATLKNSLYDSYIRAIRWASDRIENEGMVAYVSNGYYIDGNVADGLRQCLAAEFSAIYCFNLRGNVRKNILNKKSGEGANIFGNKSMTGIAITLFVKNPQAKNGRSVSLSNRKCKIYYHDIGDSLTQKQKLEKITDFSSVQKMEWREIEPNEQHDWINQRHPEFQTFLPMGDKENKKKNSAPVPSVFSFYSGGLKTNRDNWVYNFSKSAVENKMQSMIEFYNSEVNRYQEAIAENPDVNLEQFINNDPTKISWDGELKTDLKKNKLGEYSKNNIRKGIYRPFSKQWVYFDRQFNNRVYLQPSFFPTAESENLAICVNGVGARKDFSVLMVNQVPDLNLMEAGGQCFPFYRYEKRQQDSLFAETENEFRKIENIPDETLKQFHEHYHDGSIAKQDIFYYVYGLLHAPQYKSRYESDLKKMLPRIPLHPQFWDFSKAGRALGDLHVNYEKAAEYPLNEISTELLLEEDAKKVLKMKFGKTSGTEDKSKIIYNHHITLENIPLEAYEYVVNGKSAIEWVMERYQLKTDRDSQIQNDPNDWSTDPRHILRLLKKIVTVSIESVKIIRGLPGLE